MDQWRPKQDVISPAVASAIAAKAAKQTITNQQAQALKIDADTSTAKAVRLEHLQRIKLLKAQEKALGVPATIGNAVQNLDKSFKQKMDDIEWDGLWDQAIRDIGSVTDSANHSSRLCVATATKKTQALPNGNA